MPKKKRSKAKPGYARFNGTESPQQVKQMVDTAFSPLTTIRQAMLIDHERERIVREVVDSGLQHNYRLIMRIVRDQT